MKNDRYIQILSKSLLILNHPKTVNVMVDVCDINITPNIFKNVLVSFLSLPLKWDGNITNSRIHNIVMT